MHLNALVAERFDAARQQARDVAVVDGLAALMAACGFGCLGREVILAHDVLVSKQPRAVLEGLGV